MLNLYLILPLLTATVNGFDSSLINGMSLPYASATAVDDHP